MKFECNSCKGHNIDILFYGNVLQTIDCRDCKTNLYKTEKNKEITTYQFMNDK